MAYLFPVVPPTKSIRDWCAFIYLWRYCLMCRGSRGTDVAVNASCSKENIKGRWDGKNEKWKKKKIQDKERHHMESWATILRTNEFNHQKKIRRSSSDRRGNWTKAQIAPLISCQPASGQWGRRWWCGDDVFFVICFDVILHTNAALLHLYSVPKRN